MLTGVGGKLDLLESGGLNSIGLKQPKPATDCCLEFLKVIRTPALHCSSLAIL